MLLAEFKPAIPASERPRTHALDLAATGIGMESVKSSDIEDRRLTLHERSRLREKKLMPEMSQSVAISDKRNNNLK
jgi:hypothetical protein